VLGANQPIWIADPRDAQYLNTTETELLRMAADEAGQGLLALTGEYAAPTPLLIERHDVGNRQTIFLAQRHIDARHERKVKGHVAFIAVAKIGPHIGRPLIGFRQHQAVGVIGVDSCADGLDGLMRLGQVFARSSIAFDQVRDSVHAHSIHAHV
jgi:hypothetical protein